MEPIALRVSDAAKAIGLSRSRLYELLAAGVITSFRCGNARLVPTASLREFVERGATEAQAADS